MSDQKDIDMERLKKAVAELAEHFDTVQIFTTRESDHLDDGGEGTVNANYGAGNWFARYGQVRNWLVKSEEEIRLEARD